VQWNLAPTQIQGRGAQFGRGGRGGGRGIPFITANAVPPGTYFVKLTVSGKELMTSVQVQPDVIR
jgi:hypothetical protein